MRHRWRLFILQACDELRRDPKLTPDEVARIVGPKMGWMSGFGKMSDKAAIRRAEKILQHVEVTHAIRKVMGMAGLTVVGAFEKLKNLTDSEDENVALGAVRTTLSYALPKPSKQIQIDQRTLVARVDARDSAPPIRARELPALSVSPETNDA